MRGIRVCVRLAAMMLAGLLWLAVPSEAGPGQHTLTVTLDYDFTADNACSASVTKGCLQQFNVYDITSGTPVKLFSFAAPAGATGPVNGITGTSGLITLHAGTHTFAATA